ncbi:hypothetical protein ACOZ4I_19925 (plasmid) [Haloarcula salina]|uniref:hypothetical protein n=1 Tax=Haloarcula salina TaxID=1429914 RepID=UPI003C6ED9F4
MSADGLKFLYQVEVTSKNYINIPSEVYEFFKKNYEDKIKYAWHYDEDVESLLIAGIETSESKSGWLQVSTHESPNGRTRIPTKAVAQYNISEGDNLYLLTHELMGQTERPSVFVWDLERIEESMFGSNGTSGDPLSRFPSF